MALGSNTYYNPNGVTIGGTAVAGVLSFSYNESAPGIQSSADAELGTSIAGKGDTTVNWTLTFRDPVVCNTAKALTGDLVVVLDKVGAVAADKTVTIKGTVGLSVSTSVGRNGASTSTLSGIGALDTGATAVGIA